MALTDVSGIGAKTAEKLRSKGIQSKDDLFRRFEQGDPAVVDELNKRAVQGIRDALIEQEQQFTDPVMGISVGPENRDAAQTLGIKTLGDLPSVDVTQAKAGNDAEFSADTTLGELAPQAVEGELGEQGAPQSVIGWASDAAANLGIGELDSGQLQDVNRFKARDTTVQTTGPGNVYGGKKNLPDQATERYDLDAQEVARAEDFHQDRSRKARRVDERRGAPVTDEITTWKSDPDHYDYPGVDTKAQMGEFFASKRKSQRGGFGSYEKENRGDEKLQDRLERISSLDDEVQERAIGEPLDFDPLRPF